MNNYVVAVEGLSSLSDIQNLDEKILLRARQAINRTTDRTRTRSDREIRKQVAFPARYLSSRLTVSKKASGRSLEAVITGRDRPTSLARFAKNKDIGAARRKGGVSVSVGPGQTRFMSGAFLMQLRGGNLGLAIRLKEGESMRNKRKMTRVGKGLYLLYGPSVDQVFRSVADEHAAPEAADYLEREFIRLMEL
ncbi:phage tail protein [Pseudomonas stutzeri]|uniref:phage tail protein n=1 Tax=Stutzerimonas stutzeri TaxID=316 RepID=UPI00210B5BBE|nr:phage tail protein [Stutzerimonas stutzeri]MCQ4311691.1 phage tail protein [Stutzerimonas stutzeri]